MDTVVVHDGTIYPGGAVDVVLEAARALDADIVVGVSGMDTTWWEQRAPNDVRILNHSSKTGTLRDILNARRMLGLDLRQYDNVLTSGPASKFFQPYDIQSHVHYLHHPPLAKLWYDGGLFAYLQSVIDRVETHSIPKLVANSELTAERVRKHYARTATVVHPPVDISSFAHGDTVDGKFVMVGRLEERKRPLVAAEAFSTLDGCELHMVGDGPLADAVSSHQNVHLHGYVSDSELQTHLGEAQGGIFLAKREDFGITPIEYMAAGLPTVAVDEPNTNNQITDTTGVLVDPDPESVRSGVRELMDRTWDTDTIIDESRRYSTERFHTEIAGVFDDV